MRVQSFADRRIAADPGAVRITLGEILFFTGLVLWTVQMYVMRSYYEPFFGSLFTKGVRWLCVFIFAAKIMLTEETVSIKAMAVAGLAGMLMIVSQHAGGMGMTLLQLYMMLLAARGISFKRICKVSMWACLFCFIAVVLGDQLGPLHVMPLNEWDRFREYLGFQYVSFGAIYFHNIMFCAFYAYTDRPRDVRGRQRPASLSWPAIALILAGHLWLYVMTDTSLAMAVGVLGVLLYVIVVKFGLDLFADHPVIRAGALLIFPVLAVFTYYVCDHYKMGMPLWTRINDFSHNRVELTYQGLRKYGVHLFGRVVEANTDFQKGKYFYIDSGYMKNLLSLGVIFMILLLALYAMMSYSAVRTRDRVLCIWMLCVALYSIFNNYMISPVENTSILAIWYAASALGERRAYDREKEIRRRRKRSRVCSGADAVGPASVRGLRRT